MDIMDIIDDEIALALEQEPKNEEQNELTNYSQKRIKEEKKNGRKINENKNIKVSEQKVFTNLTDEKLFCQENKDNLKEYLIKMNMCVDENCLNPQCKNFIIVYTNKKVGSTSLWGSLNLYLSSVFKTTHIHSSYELERCGIFDITMQQFLKILKLYNKNVFVIDIYRPIFDICVSNFFNELNSHFQRDFDKYPTIENKDIIINRFFKLFKIYYITHNVDYYKEQYDIPEENIPESFDFVSKHLMYKDENIKYIKLRLCDSDNWHNILSEYLGYKFKIIKYNESEKKAWGPLYKYFKENYKITTEIYDMLKNNKYFKYYYTSEEQENYLKQFNNRIDNENTITHYTRDEYAFYNLLQRENEVNNLYSDITCSTNSPIANNFYSKKAIEYHQELILKYDFYDNSDTNINMNNNLNYENQLLVNEIIKAFNTCNLNIRIIPFMSVNGQSRLLIDNITQNDLEQLSMPVIPNIHDQFIDDFNFYFENDKSDKIVNFPGLSDTISQLYNYLNENALTKNINYHTPFSKPFTSNIITANLSISEYIDLQNKILKIEEKNTGIKLFKIIINPSYKIKFNRCINNNEDSELLDNIFT